MDFRLGRVSIALNHRDANIWICRRSACQSSFACSTADRKSAANMKSAAEILRAPQEADDTERKLQEKLF